MLIDIARIGKQFADGLILIQKIRLHIIRIRNIMQIFREFLFEFWMM